MNGVIIFFFILIIGAAMSIPEPCPKCKKVEFDRKRVPATGYPVCSKCGHRWWEERP